MRSGRKNGKRSNSSRTSSPAKDRSPLSSSSHFETRPNRSNPRATTVLDRELVTATGEDIAAFQDLRTSPDYNNPRSFPYSIKQKCWEKAEKIKGRDPDRWRRDPLGNTIFRKLVGCPGCLCHDYDHILPYSKGGQSTLENCQVLQATVNRSKGNRTDISRADLMQKSSYCRVSGSDMDLLELYAYGNVRRGKDSGGCNIQ